MSPSKENTTFFLPEQFSYKSCGVLGYFFKSVTWEEKKIYTRKEEEEEEVIYAQRRRATFRQTLLLMMRWKRKSTGDGRTTAALIQFPF